jgi:hypothetical protein
MMQRKNKPASKPPQITKDHAPPTPAGPPVTGNAPPAAIATVYRRKCGTGPFDENWLNMDCCGLFCAAMTYSLHLYGCWVFCAVLIPPWMSYKGVDGIRRLTIFGKLNCLMFVAIAIAATLSHFKAMTTDPGAVPPDASPLPDPDEETDKKKPIRSPTMSKMGLMKRQLPLLSTQHMAIQPCQ